MLTHEEMVGLQSEKHELIEAREFQSKESFVLHLMHAAAYVEASIIAKGKSVLDLGCNTGYGTELLSRSARRVVGVDVSPDAIAAAQALYASQGIEYRLVDGKQLPFADGEFDMVISCQVIEHIVDYTIYFGEIKRVLSPGGIAIFTTPNALLRLDPGMKPWNQFHVREFEGAELQSLLEKHFPSVKIKGLFAADELYLVEKTRVEYARAMARCQAGRGRQPLRSMVKRWLPKRVLSLAKRLLRPESPSEGAFDERFMQRHGVADFYYREENLSEALDFQAVCKTSAAA